MGKIVLSVIVSILILGFLGSHQEAWGVTFALDDCGDTYSLFVPAGGGSDFTTVGPPAPGVLGDQKDVFLDAGFATAGSTFVAAGGNCTMVMDVDGGVTSIYNGGGALGVDLSGHVAIELVSLSLTAPSDDWFFSVFLDDGINSAFTTVPLDPGAATTRIVFADMPGINLVDRTNISEIGISFFNDGGGGSLSYSAADIVEDVNQPIVGDFKCYKIPTEDIPDKILLFDDQFSIEPNNIELADRVCVFVMKAENIAVGFDASVNPAHLDRHYKVYNITATPEPMELVSVTDQFGTETHVVMQPTEVWIPAVKQIGFEFFDNGDLHWKCYEIDPITPIGFPFSAILQDQFFLSSNPVFESTRLCTSVVKTDDFGDNFGDNTIPDHLKCYRIGPDPGVEAALPLTGVDFFEQITDFLPIASDLIEEVELCVFADKQLLSTLVGGEFIPIKPVSLLVAGFQVNAIWMIPVIGTVAGAGLVIQLVRRRK